MSNTQMTHEEVATALAATETKQKAGKVARQGDVVLVRTGDAMANVRVTPQPRGGWLVAAGKHGEHRLFAEGASVVDGKASLPNGGVLVHTDVPSSRHGSFTLEPGMWVWHQSRELRAGEVVKVED